jgi:hypothetical protein
LEKQVVFCLLFVAPFAGGSVGYSGIWSKVGLVRFTSLFLFHVLGNVLWWLVGHLYILEILGSVGIWVEMMEMMLTMMMMKTTTMMG